MSGTDTLKPEAGTEAGSGEAPFPPLEKFEADVRAGNHEAALSWFRQALVKIGIGGGSLAWLEADIPDGLPAAGRLEHKATRLAAAAGDLFSDPALALDMTTFNYFIVHWRTLSSLFGATAYRNADHFIRRLMPEGLDFSKPGLDRSTLAKIVLLYTGNSNLPLEAHLFWRLDRDLASNLFLALLTSRLVATPAARDKKDALLGWLPRRLATVDALNAPNSFLASVYMMSSYSDLPDKHAIKTPFNRILRYQLSTIGLGDVTTPPPEREKPLMFVVLEWFHRNHSVFRTHSATLEACRERFRLVGAGTKVIDEAGRALFDEFTEFKETGSRIDFVKEACALAYELRPDIVYYPSVGMFDHTIWLATLRLAPLQVTSTGHTATTKSDVMDYYIVDEDFIGDPACFSEKLLPMPVGAMPHVPSSYPVPDHLPAIRVNPDKLRIAVPATLMKLNPGFFKVCAKIRVCAERPVEFHFLMGLCAELEYLEVRRAISAYLPDAIVYPHQPFEKYIERLGACDIFLSPFPFGSWNSIVDSVRVAVPGVCLSGREVHSHADEGFFRRFGLPDWLVARNEEEYVAAVLRLVHEDEERVEISRALERLDLDAALFRGQPEIFADKLAALVAEHKAACLTSSS